MAPAEEIMARRLGVWSPVAHVLDAFSLMKPMGAVVLFVLLHGSPLFALGIVFTTSSNRRVHPADPAAAATGREWRAIRLQRVGLE